MPEFKIGGKAKIKQDSWIKFLKEQNKDPNQPNPGEKEIIHMPNNPPFTNHIMLSSPFYWWKESDLDPIE